MPPSHAPVCATRLVSARERSRITACSCAAKPERQPQHQLAGRRSGIEFLGHATHTHIAFFEFVDRVQDLPSVSAQAIQFVDQDLIDLLETGVAEHAAPCGAAL